MSKLVGQYSLFNDFIQQWDSVKKASVALNIKQSGIRSCCRRKQKNCGGFIWRYLNETLQDYNRYMDSYNKRIIYNKEYRKINKDRYKQLRKEKKITKSKYDKKYRKKHINRISKLNKNYYYNNKNEILKKQREYYNENKDKAKKYYENNKEHIINEHKLRSKNNASYAIYYNQLTIDECPILHSDGWSLKVKCRYCGKYFVPTNLQVRHRVNALNNSGGQKSLYCSEGCKKACPIYNQQSYVKGFKKTTSREVQAELRQRVLERDNYECKRCFKSISAGELHCHHILPINESPIESADVSNCITLCKVCHKEVHKLPGCSYHQLKCS